MFGYAILCCSFTWQYCFGILHQNSAPVSPLSVGEGWRRNYISPEGQCLPDGVMWFSEPLVDWCEQYWSPSHWSYLPSPSWYCQSVQPHSPLLQEECMHFDFFVLWYPDCSHTTYAPVLLISVCRGFGDPHLPVGWVLTSGGNILCLLTIML